MWFEDICEVDGINVLFIGIIIRYKRIHNESLENDCLVFGMPPIIDIVEPVQRIWESNEERESYEMKRIKSRRNSWLCLAICIQISSCFAFIYSSIDL